ncbi:MAG: Na/Pi symporter [Oscillospiraceae bacterium]|nr:Na/Pi symporter [Oscillospiraceae bacterium]
MKNIAGLLLGIGLFLFGIEMMQETAESLYSEKMKKVIGSLTGNRIRSALTGAAVTGVIQSSCATTVMTLGFITSGMMTLENAVGVIMGANIGTTVTSLLLSFHISSLAPFAVFLGAFIRLFSKSGKLRIVSIFLVAFGLMFGSMSIMESSMTHFSGDVEQLIGNGLGKTKSLLLGFLVTAVMQSSSATVGILQTAAKAGLVTTTDAVFMIFGQNIGAVVPTLLASLGSDRKAKQAAVIHLLFNLIGTALFVLISLFTPYCSLLDKITDPKMRISMAHIIFNVVSTFVLLPFSNPLVRISDKVVSRNSP